MVKTIFEQAKTSRYCLMSVVWNEGERCNKQLEVMRPYTADYDFIIVNRGDDLLKLGIEKFKLLNIRTLLQLEEPGQSIALQTGFRYAIEQGYQGIIMVDANGKDGVSAIPEFVAQLDKGFDLVQGSRFMKGGQHVNTPWFRQFAIRIVVPMLFFFRPRFSFSDQSNGFKGLSRRFLLSRDTQLLRPIFKGHELQAYLNHIAAKKKFHIVEIPVERSYPQGELPTKISSWHQYFDLFCSYCKIAMGRFDP